MIITTRMKRATSHTSYGKARGRERDNNSRTNERRYDKANAECYNRHKFGYYSWEYFNATNLVEDKANIVNEKIETEDLTLLLALKN